MKRFLIVLAVLMMPVAALAQTTAPVIMPVGVSAQTTTTPDTEKAWLKSCDTRRDPRMSMFSQSEMCNCAIMQMGESLNPADIQALGQNDQAGRLAQNKMLLDVYTPCLGLPIQAMAEVQCQKAPDLAKFTTKTTTQDLCRCAGRKTGYWFVAGGRDLVTQLLIANPAMMDPVGPVMDSPAFKQALQDGMTACAAAAP